MKRTCFQLLAAAVSLCGMTFERASAQDPPMQWGEIPKSALEMKSFPADTSASAVILCDYGETSFNNDLNLVFRRHMRIKILTTKGYSLGNHVVSMYTKDKAENISDIEGVTYTVAADGSVVKKQLEAKDIFMEKVNAEYSNCRFTLPGLQPGCVIEFRYTVEADNLWDIRDWEFQYDEPALWSEYRVRSPRQIGYVAVTTGYEPFAVNEVQDAVQSFFGTAQSYLRENVVQCHQMRWVATNMPALRDEPFVTTLDDYRNRVDMQLSGYALGGGITRVLNTWEKVGEDLMQSQDFGKKIDDTNRAEKQATAITAGLSAPREKMNAIYTWIATSIVWSGEHRLFADQEIDDILETRKGTSADITFLLLSMLKSVGIGGDPVILSTRTHGRIQEQYPIVRQFNYVLARVTLGAETYYLDATDPLRPMELLPTETLNVRGLVIREEGVEWVTLQSQARSSTTSIADVRIGNDGELRGTLEDYCRDYAGVSMRRDLKDKKEADIAKQGFDTDASEISVDSIVVEGKDSVNQQLHLKAWVSSPGYVQVNGDLMYVNPHVIHRFRKSPFTRMVRKFPANYGYGRDQSIITTITIPDGFELRENVGPRTFAVSPDDAVFTRKVMVDGNRIQIATRFEIRRAEIASEKYKQLRDFYGRVVAAQAEQIVLSRKSKPMGQGKKK